MEAVTVKNLSFRYPETGTDVLNDISFSIPQGAFVTLCGLSGSGKSTLLRQLKPALAPHGVKNGTIKFNNIDLTELSFRDQSEKIGFVQQSPDQQIVTDKVWHELAFGLESLGLPNNEINRRVAETASFFGLQSVFDSEVSQLSGGQKQLLNLASVMVMQPELLLFDEPTSQLDPIAAAEFLSCLQKINRELGTTVIITEHRLDDIIPISDKVLVLENGRLISDDTPENTGINLKKANSECFLSLPAPMRIWEAVTTGESKCPVTITNGKAWLEEYSNNHKLHLLYEEKIPQCGDTAIQLKNIWFRYEKNSPDIIRGLSLQARFGEFLCILGGNGTGKSTLFSLINGNNKPYKGSNNSKRELCLTLPQNPQTLLNGKTVIETLNAVFEGTKLSKAERDKTIGETVALCGLEKLMSRHPFDLSGGEMQKTALAKLLLLKPKILLLDEPTKGLDAAFKEIFAKIISRLTANGTAVVMVSHDLEFCAKYAHRCALMFNGEVVANDTPRAFFNNNSFYVTAASRMSRGIIQDAITAEDVIYCCTGKRNQDDNEKQLPPAKLPEFEVVKQKKQLPLWKKLLGISGALLLVFGIIENLNLLPFLSSESLPIWANFTFIAVPVLMLMLALSSLSEKSKDVFVKKKLSKRTIAAAIMILLMIPVTIYIGNVYLYDQKYLFISLLVLLECMVPFFLVFEGRKPQARELILIAVLCF